MPYLQSLIESAADVTTNCLFNIRIVFEAKTFIGIPGDWVNITD